MKTLHYIIIAAGLVFACKKDDPSPISACGVTNPVENLPWLKTMIHESSKKGGLDNLKVSLFHYKGNSYFSMYQSYMSCLGCYLYDCAGNPVDISSMPAGKDYEEFIKNSFSDSVVVIWKGKNAY